jgi:hypothetical protein
MRSLIAAALAVLIAPAAAHAQLSGSESPSAALAAQQGTVRPPPSRVPAGRRTIARAYFLLDSTAMTATGTFDAVIGTSRLVFKGGGAEALNLWRGVFARVALSSVKETGSRVAVLDDEVIPLDIPLSVELTPLEIGAGWRFPALAGGHLVPYVGGGWLRMGYKETSEFAIGDENTDTAFNGSVMFTGVEVVFLNWMIAGAEVQYRSVPGALGDGGVSEVYEEDDLGGVTLRGLLGVRW